VAADICSRAASEDGCTSRGASTPASSTDGWRAQFSIFSAYGTHSLPNEAGTALQGDRRPRAVQLLLGHPKLESTVHYLGIEVDDALSLSEQVEL
jgi:hypothetical protein